VSANSRLRERAVELADRKKLNIAIPPLRYCTDNAAMIGLVGQLQFKANRFADLNLAPKPKSTIFKSNAV